MIALWSRSLSAARRKPSRWRVSNVSRNGSVHCAGEDDLFFNRLAALPQHGLVVKRIAVEERKQSNLFALRLELSCHRVSDEAAKRPTEQIIGSGRLNLPNNAQIFGGYFFDRIEQGALLTKAVRLVSEDRVTRRDMTDEPRIRQTEPGRWMHAE